MKQKLTLSLIVAGITGLITQIILFREIPINFAGNELTIGIILFLWLIGISIGSLLFSKFISENDDNRLLSIITNLQLATSIFVILAIVIAKISKATFNIPHYELIDFRLYLSITILAVIPIAFILGGCFVTLTAYLSKNIKNKSSGIGFSYIAEAIGNAIAGILFSYILIKYLNHIQIISIITILNLLCYLTLSNNIRNKTVSYSAAIVILIFLLAVNYNSLKLEQLRFGEEKLIYTKNSIYGNISITKKDDQFNLYSNGSLSFTTEDTEANEELTHLALLEAPKVDDILLIGNGINGILTEILKHSPKKIDYIELDPLLIKSSFANIPNLDLDSLSNSRVNIQYSDARNFIKNTLNKYDCVILNTPDPLNIQINRYFTKEFFEEVSKILKTNGILCINISSKENYLSREIALYNASVLKTLNSVFKETLLIPSWKLILISSNNQGTLTLDPSILKNRFKERNLNTNFFTPYHIDYRIGLNKTNINYIKQTLSNYMDAIDIDHDFSGSSFFNALTMWLKETSNISKIPTKSNLKTISFIIVAIVIIWLLFAKNKILQGITFTTGLASMGSEFIMLLAFQSIFGFLYYSIGIIIAAFMIGLSLGGFMMIQILTKKDLGLNKLKMLELSIILFLATLGTSLYFSKQHPIFSSQALFIILSTIIGFIVGSEFPLITHIALKRNKSILKTSGIFYSCDVFGAAIGGLLSSLILFPALGLYGMLFCIGIIKIVALLVIPKKLQQ